MALPLDLRGEFLEAADVESLIGSDWIRTGL